MPQSMLATLGMGAQFLRYAIKQPSKGTLNVALAVVFMLYEHHSIVVITTEEVKMLSLGPHIIRHQFPDGEIEETPVRFNFLGPKETVISETISITQESGEVIVELPDGEHRTFIEAENTFALVGRAIKLTEALFLGWSLEDNGKAFRLVPGDVKGPGDMFI